jgi:protein required for attachment to host cells
MRIWIVVADEREALFYDAKGPHGPFDLAMKIDNATTDAQRIAQTRFARQVAGEIERARAARRFERFVIMSGPRMLGLIRGALAPASRAILAGEVAKDLAPGGERPLERRLPDALDRGRRAARDSELPEALARRLPGVLPATPALHVR